VIPTEPTAPATPEVDAASSRRPAEGPLEASFGLPRGVLPVSVLATAVAASAASAGIGLAVGASPGAAGAGAAVAGAVALLGTVILRPSESRLASDWMTLWLAATVVRLLLTPLAALLLYFALSPPRVEFLLSVAGSYLACLAVETAILARSAGRAFAAASSMRGARAGSRPAGDRS
jgi:hypothetical protein